MLFKENQYRLKYLVILFKHELVLWRCDVDGIGYSSSEHRCIEKSVLQHGSIVHIVILWEEISICIAVKYDS